jgi:hypothetical protein
LLDDADCSVTPGAVASLLVAASSVIAAAEARKRGDVLAG